MAISKLNADQFANLKSTEAGIIFEYAGKDGKNSGLIFFGKDYEATAKTQDEAFRVLKNVVATFWEVKTAETTLRKANDGIRSKLRASTPFRIIVRSAKGETLRNYALEDSVWAKIGLMPTKVDLERSARNRKKYIHSAAQALMDALNFRVELPKEEELPSTKTTAEKPAPKATAEKPAEVAPATTDKKAA